MARWHVIAVAGLLGFVMGPTAGFAQTTTRDETSENQAQEEETQRIDQEAATPEGAHTVQQRFINEFGVEEARVQGLRDQQLGYGEVHHVLSLAKQMPGGITDENVNKILAMRQEQHMGWGRISKELTGKSLGAVEGRGGTEAASQSVVRQGTPSGLPPSTEPSTTGRALGGEHAVGHSGTQGGNTFGGGMGGGRGRSGSAPGHVR